jgi:hypothetical protein
MPTTLERPSTIERVEAPRVIEPRRFNFIRWLGWLALIAVAAGAVILYQNWADVYRDDGSHVVAEEARMLALAPAMDSHYFAEEARMMLLNPYPDDGSHLFAEQARMMALAPDTSIATAELARMMRLDPYPDDGSHLFAEEARMLRLAP